MNLQAKVIEHVRDIYPDRTPAVKGKLRTMHSRIYFVELRSENGPPLTVAAKHCTSCSSEEMMHEHYVLDAFRRRCSSQSIKAPTPLRIDSENKLMIMEDVGGQSLKEMMLEFGNRNTESITRSIDLAAVALSRFHKAFSGDNGESPRASPFLENGIDLNRYHTLSESCGLHHQSKSFLDFAVWNILVDKESGGGIYLIDFPGRNVRFTPHLDLARFKFSLQVLRQYPQFRYLGLEPWNLSETYERFLCRYAEEAEAELNDSDVSLINHLEREYAQKLLRIYENGSSRMRLLIEGIYMGGFLRGLTAKNRGNLE